MSTSGRNETGERVLEITSGSRNPEQPHLIVQSLSRILPTSGEPSLDLEVRTNGGLDTVQPSNRSGRGRGDSAPSLVVGQREGCGVNGFERVSLCVSVCWLRRKDKPYRYLESQADSESREWASWRTLHPLLSPPQASSDRGLFEERRGAQRQRSGYGGRDPKLPDVLQQIRLPLLPGLKDVQLLQEAKLHLLGRLHLRG